MSEWRAVPRPLARADHLYLNRLRWLTVLTFAAYAVCFHADGTVTDAEMTAVVLTGAALMPFALLADWIAGGSRGL